MNKRTVLIITAAVLVLAIIGTAVAMIGSMNSRSLTKLPATTIYENPNTIYPVVTLIAQVKIVRRIGLTEDGNYTRFAATLTDVIKGDVKKGRTIEIKQFGNKQMIIENYPLFKTGDKLILFLVQSETGGDYEIFRGFMTTFRIIGGSQVVCIQRADEAVFDMAERQKLAELRNNLAKSTDLYDAYGGYSYDLTKFKEIITRMSNEYSSHGAAATGT